MASFSDLRTRRISLIGDGRHPAMNVPLPLILRDNLLTKRIGIRDMTLDTTSLPRFVPSIFVNSGSNLQNFDTGAPDSIYTPRDIDFDVDITNYYVIIRKKAADPLLQPEGTRACCSFVVWNDPNNLSKAPRPNEVTPFTVYALPYYYSYNFMDFLTMVETAINKGYEKLFGSYPTNPVYLVYEAETQTFNLSAVPDMAGDNSQYQIEFSQNLYDIFRFQHVQINPSYFTNTNIHIPTYVIKFSPISVDYGNVNYLNTTCRSTNNIFPFDLFFLECNLPLQQTLFSSSNDTSINDEQPYTILYEWKIKQNALNLDDYLTEERTNLVERLKQFNENYMQGDKLRCRLFARTRKEGFFIELVLQAGEKLEFGLNVYNVIDIDGM